MSADEPARSARRLHPPRASIRPNVRYVWRGPSMLVVDHQGACGTDPTTGFFFRETRFLSRLRLLVQGEEPFTCSVAEAEPHELELSYVYPPVSGAAGGGSGSGGSGSRRGVLYRDLELDLRYVVSPNGFDALLRVTNRWQERVELALAWELAADYVGAAEAQQKGSGSSGQPSPERHVDRTTLVFRHRDPELTLETRAKLTGPGAWEADEAGLAGRLALGRQEEAEVQLEVLAVDPADPMDAAGVRRRLVALRDWQDRVTRLEAPGEPPLIEITNRAMRELGSMALLEGPEEAWLAPAAGMPTYPALFGRDALTATWQAAALDRGRMVRASLAALRATQGTRIDDWRDEEPGRIIQQARRNPAARRGRTPFDRYYGDHASPLMFIIGLGQLYAWSGDRKDVDTNWPAARAALDWARRYGDGDGDGYLEYVTRSPQGPKNQGWKDSDNAMVHADGSQAVSPGAPCEIQGYWYAALQFMAVMSAFRGDLAAARQLWTEAARLKERFNRDFWLEDEGYLALGLDTDKRPLRALSSNAAQCITTGIVADEHLPRLVQRLFREDLFSGWGLRTLSTQNPSYHPLSYHLGSVWPVENGSILFGLRRYGFVEEANRLAKALYDLARMWDGNRIPECVGGYAREARAHPGAYPRANAPQAWNRSTWAILIQGLLGMRPVAALNLLALDPHLPPWLPDVTLRRLQVGDAVVDLHAWRDGKGRSELEVLDLDGSLRIVRQPPLNSLYAGLWDRLRSLVDGVVF